MEVNRITLNFLFGPDVRLLVPLFQRLYVWKQKENWEPLWDSITTVAERRLKGNSIQPYFLGAVVFQQMKTETGEVDERRVIDGQQRLTTL